MAVHFTCYKEAQSVSDLPWWLSGGYGILVQSTRLLLQLLAVAATFQGGQIAKMFICLDFSAYERKFINLSETVKGQLAAQTASTCRRCMYTRYTHAGAKWEWGTPWPCLTESVAKAMLRWCTTDLVSGAFLRNSHKPVTGRLPKLPKLQLPWSSNIAIFCGLIIVIIDTPPS